MHTSSGWLVCSSPATWKGCPCGVPVGGITISVHRGERVDEWVQVYAPIDERQDDVAWVGSVDGRRAVVRLHVALRDHREAVSVAVSVSVVQDLERHVLARCATLEPNLVVERVEDLEHP